MMANHIQLELYEAEEALSHISPDLPYKRWSKIGRALVSEYGNDARDIFERWSATGNSYDKRGFKSWWKNFQRVKRTSFGSFIYEAMEAGWKPKKKDYSEEERQKLFADYEKRKKAAERRRIQAEQEQWNELKKEEKLFLGWPDNFAPTGYMIKKQMADISRFVDVRLGRDKYNNPCLVWPIYEELFNQGRFCGFERILDNAFQIGERTINKLSSDNARTDLGFCTFGEFRDHGPKRVFVVGGFADAYSAHVSTGEVIVTPIGEGNIPFIIELLREKHPDIQFIAAPDNDKAGWEVVQSNNCFWTLPQTDGFDWSDTFINLGWQAVQEQLLNIRGFEKVESNTRYLTASIREGLNLIESDMGTGKSTVVQNYIKQNPDKKTLVISHRVALAKSLKEGLAKENVSVEFYQDLIIKDPVPGTDANIALRNAHVLVCSVDSLWRLACSNWDVVFVDEFEQNLSQYYAKTIQHGEKCLNYLQFVLKNSETQILADAHLGNLTFDFCHFIGMHTGVYFQNTFQVAKGKKMYVYESKDHLLEEVMQQIMAKGKRYIYANSKEQVKAIGTAIEQERERKHYDGAVLVVHADVTGTEEVKTALEDINAIVPNLDVLIASPTLGTGFDIKSSAHKFDKTIGFLSSRVGTAEEGHQGLNRARDVKEFHVYLDNAERSEPTDPTYIQDKLIEQVSAETMKVLDIDPTTGNYTSRNPVYEWLFCQVKAKQNQSSNRYRARFLELAAKGGYEIIEVAKQKLAADFGATVREEAKERNNRVTLRDIEQAPVHVGDMFTTVMRNGEDYTPTEITKSKVNYDLHLDAANDEQLDFLLPFAKEVYEEFAKDGANAKHNDIDNALTLPESKRNAIITALTYKQNKSRFVDAIKKLGWVNVCKDTAHALDRKDVNHAESRVSWRHLSIKRGHLVKLLQVAGIDEQLNYNGKEWTADDLRPHLYDWLRKKSTQDRLYKYSGITVSEKTLQEPVQWFNNHLRSFGVPIESRKKRINSRKAVNAYFVHLPEWEAVKTLVALRTQGIEESLQDSESLDVDTIQRQVAAFINDLSETEFKPGYKVRFDKLDEQCRLTGLTDLRDEMAAAFAPFMQEIDDQITPKYDPPLPLFINNNTAQGGSQNHAQDTSNDGRPAHIEGRGECPSIEFPETATHALSKDHVEVVYEVANIAVNEFKLDAAAVIKVMLEYGLENIEHSAKAWAGSIKQAIMEGI
ncbi:plasmid replication protein, CyRepA1 family [Vibrio sp. Vb2853]|uniref:plasmid replication protein, CyRepA1 family n=2 Tax=Vibrio TaxID=662 RepID=UPI0029649671|nr:MULTISPECIES: plasmid replication protein, CyRepA1 family [unclassified Vibrio]MDW1621501.1 plasmid replication protein, CyRepA1 family [Vibrio sp. Vb2864]MDW1693688.1 plasmid replication protein, CyRepA1 family [Vibrio sp. Vb2853]MDW1712397.1 plasmid replication protein, CyRepA1 family [Vibrio sp. Vb2865]MDW1717518.1 plasmid replication protein, CyRepA1 family [Vibrio sp. Vb2873]